jgi:hypothetical protein
LIGRSGERAIDDLRIAGPSITRSPDHPITRSPDRPISRSPDGHHPITR